MQLFQKILQILSILSKFFPLQLPIYLAYNARATAGSFVPLMIARPSGNTVIANSSTLSRSR